MHFFKSSICFADKSEERAITSIPTPFYNRRLASSIFPSALPLALPLASAL